MGILFESLSQFYFQVPSSVAIDFYLTYYKSFKIKIILPKNMFNTQCNPWYE